MAQGARPPRRRTCIPEMFEHMSRIPISLSLYLSISLSLSLYIYIYICIHICLDFSARAGLNVFAYDISLRGELRSQDISEKI